MSSVSPKPAFILYVIPTKVGIQSLHPGVKPWFPTCAGMTKRNGFTLAELLIALALLGIIAAFTIPKVLQAHAEQERVAKLRETVATLENAWYNVRATNSVVAGGLYEQLEGGLNIISGSIAPITAAGFDPAHPCMLQGPTGHFQFPNGVMVTGVRSIGYLVSDLSQPTTVPNTGLCIDINGLAPPNLMGQDVFYGVFNPWGDFDVGSGVVYTPGINNKSFFWGNPAEDVYSVGGAPIGTAATDRVGTWIAR